MSKGNFGTSGSPAPVPVPITDDKLENIENKKELGSGRFAIVYAGSFKGQAVAIKKYTEEAKRILYNVERDTYNKCDHHYITRMLGFNDVKRALVLERAVTNLERRMKGKLDIRTILGIIKQIATALGHLADKKIVIGDLTPQNILFDKYGDIKLSDFGGAADVGKKNETMSELYSAPEVSPGETTLTSDIFNLGVIILELATRDEDLSKTEVPSTLGEWVNKVNALDFGGKRRGGKRAGGVFYHIGIKAEVAVKNGKYLPLHTSLMTGNDTKDQITANFLTKLGHSCAKFDPGDRLASKDIISKIDAFLRQSS